MDQVNSAAWVGRSQREHGGIDPVRAAQIHATLGTAQGAPPAPGAALPPLWHWCAFPPLTHVEDLGRDGHPGPGALLPPLPLPRRMWAGGQLTFHAPIRVGDPLERTSRVRAVTHKEAASGPMAFVTVDHSITGPRGLAVEERQDIVYMQIPEAFVPPKKQALPTAPVRRVAMTPPLLMRFSAITFNAHRIHYDQAYTQRVEHYPDLVVHGPLQAMLLMRHAVALRGSPPRLFGFRGVHPMFVGSDLEIATREEDGALALWTGQHGHQCTQATAVWEGTV